MDEENLDTQEPTSGVDEFDAAFNDAAGEQGTPAPAPAQEEPQAAKPDGTASDDAAGDEGAPSADDEGQEPGTAQEPNDKQEPGDGEPDKTEPAEPAKNEPAAPAPKEQLDPKFLAKAIAEAQEESERKRKEQAEAEKPAQALTADALMSEDDKQLVNKFKTEWPEEHAAVQRMMDANIKAAVGNALSAYTQQINQVLAPVLASVQAVEVNTHEGTILAAHPDAKQIVPQVLEWIETQPTVMRGALSQAIERGTAQEIVEVLNLYKAAKVPTGAAPATPASSAAQEPQKPTKVPDRKAVAALAAVPAAQRPRPQGTDRNDFDGAFAEATEQLANS